MIEQREKARQKEAGGDGTLNASLGQKWGSYRLVRLLGRGGFAEVYLGEHIRLGMLAAIKILHIPLSDTEPDAFQQEAQYIAELSHPHIVRVLDFDIQAGKPFLVLEYAPDGSLRQKYPRGTRPPLPLVVEYISQTASALQYAHEKKLVHRDVKPENMLLGRQGQVLLSDFGLAIIAHSTLSMATQEFQGTLPYMAPEQIQGYPRAASDQYALGVVAYQWLTGSLPFQGSPSEIVAQHLAIVPRALRQDMPQISDEVESVIQKALSKDPRARFESVLAFAEALQQAAQTTRLFAQSVETGMPLSDFSASTSLPPTFRARPHTRQLEHSQIPPSSPETPPNQDVSTPRLPMPASTSGPWAKEQHTVTMHTEDIPLALLATSPLPIIPETPVPGAVYAPTTKRLLDEPVLPTPVPTSSLQSKLAVTASAHPAITSRRPNSRRMILFAAAICLLILGGIAFRYAFSLASPTTGSSLRLSSANKLTGTNATASATRPLPTATPGSNHSIPPAGMSGSTPTAQPTASSSSTPASQPTSTLVPDCFSGSPSTVTITQILGASVSLPGTAITLTNCSTEIGHWTGTAQIDDGSSWTTCSPVSGDIPANSSQTVHIVAGSPDILLGTYTARWIFTLGTISWTTQVKLVVVV